MRCLAFSLALIVLAIAPARADCGKLPEPVAVFLNDNPGWTLLQIKDLGSDDQALWLRYHKHACPGLAIVDLNGSGVPSYAVALHPNGGNKIFEQLVVIEGKSSGRTNLIQAKNIKLTDIPALLVVWRAPPGIYTDFYSGKQTRLRHDGIGFEKIEASVTVYFKKAGKFHSILASD